MPRIRTVKPELFCHVKLFEAEIATKLPLRLAFIALFSCCDDKGRFSWELPRLKIHLLPYDEVNIADVLEALVIYGFIKKYEYEGEFYGCVPSWLRHQKVGSSEEPSRFPAIEESRVITIQKRDFSNLNNVYSSEEAINNNSNPITTTDNKTSPEVLDETTEQKPVEILSQNESKKDDFLSQKIKNLGERKGREGKGKERKDRIVEPKVRSQSVAQEAEVIFEHWKVVMKHPDAKLDPTREALIRKALKFGYNVEQLCQAITGCSLTPHNIGHNDRGQRYDGLHVILRDSDQIDRFRHNYHYPPRLLTEAERKTEANVQSLRNWVNQKMQEGVVNGTT